MMNTNTKHRQLVTLFSRNARTRRDQYHIPLSLLGTSDLINEVTNGSMPHRPSRHTKAVIYPMLSYEGCSGVRRQLAGVL